MKIYISHPYENFYKYQTDDPRAMNRNSEEEYAKHIQKLYEDAELIRPFKMISPDVSREEAMRICFSLLLQCDMIVLCSEWEDSEGCDIEHSIASQIGLDIIEFRDNSKPRDYRKYEEQFKLQ